MSIRLGNVTILVRDYDEVLKFYTEQLGFEKRMDQKFGPAARWLTIAAPGQDIQIVLQKPEPAMHGEEGARKMTERIGQNPTWVLMTDDCQKTYELYSSRGVRFRRSPQGAGVGRTPGGVQGSLRELLRSGRDARGSRGQLNDRNTSCACLTPRHLRVRGSGMFLW